jgi:Phosphoribosyl transferase domain
VNPVGLSVYCLVPYFKAELYNSAARSADEEWNREFLFAFKNGRAMRPKCGGHSFVDVVGKIVARYAESPLSKIAAETAWVPVPRSGASQPSAARNSDLFPCLTLVLELAKRFGDARKAYTSLERPITLQQEKKRNVVHNINTLAVVGPIPRERRVVLVDDVATTGSTLVACAHLLRDQGYKGSIAAFCVAYDVDPRDAHSAQPPNREWLIRWAHPYSRPRFKPVGTWG